MRTFHLVYKEKHWVLEAEKPATDGIDFEYNVGKKEAVRASRDYCIMLYADTGDPVSLRIHKKNGQIQSERTYPRSADPRKTKG